MKYFTDKEIESIQMALNGNIVDSDFETKASSYDPDSRSIYKQDIECEGIEGQLCVLIDPVKGATVFEYTWFKFVSYNSPTTDEIIEEMNALSEIEDEIHNIVEDTSYSFSKGALNQNSGNASNRYAVMSPGEKFNPSLLYEGEDISLSIGLAREQTETPF